MRASMNLINQVKDNCNISDSQFWGYYSICGMLMRMRELYRHEANLNIWDSIPKQEISPWIAEREKLWLDLEELELKPIIIEDKVFDPFKANEINKIIDSNEQFYCAGYGIYKKPVFVIAELKKHITEKDINIYYCGKEHCHDLAVHLAMSQGNNIYIRLEQIQVFLWEKLQEAKCNSKKWLLKDAFATYGINIESNDNEKIFAQLGEMALFLAEIIALHEKGEIIERNENWLEILSLTEDRLTELYMRAIKDILADLTSNGPLAYIIKEKSRVLLSFFYYSSNEIQRKIIAEVYTYIQKSYNNLSWNHLADLHNEAYNKIKNIKDEILKTWENNKNLDQIKSYLTTNFDSN